MNYEKYPEKQIFLKPQEYTKICEYQVMMQMN